MNNKSRSVHGWMNGVGIFGFLALLLVSYQALYTLPSEKNMGDIYRIIYIHVPSAFSCFLGSFVLCCVSLFCLFKKSGGGMLWARATAEVSLVFTALTLLTGMLWGHPTWNTWWTWDARLTTTLLLAVLLCGYLVLYGAIDFEHTRRKACSILGILIFVDVPIIYKSVTWWRTLHQPPSMFRSEGSTMSPEIFNHILFSFGAMVLVGIWLIWSRQQNLKVFEQIEAYQERSIREEGL